jgi:hypothetical protein
MSSNAQLNTDVAHPARVYDYILGGKDNFKADRELGDKLMQSVHGIKSSMRANRAFMTRAARHLAAERGVRQFLDIGTGLPTSPNLHEVAQATDPTSRVVYVDNDPIVLAHARALLTSTAEGKTGYLDADFRTPQAILAAPELGILDLDQPVAVFLLAIMHYVLDEEAAHRIVETLMEPLPSGSYLAISTLTGDSLPGGLDEGMEAYNRAGIPLKMRDRELVEGLFRGMELVDPGVVLVHRWHSDERSGAYSDELVHMYGGVGVKP